MLMLLSEPNFDTERYLIIKRNDREDLNLYAYDLHENPPWKELNEGDIFECYPIKENGKDIDFQKKREAKRGMFIAVNTMDYVMR